MSSKFWGANTSDSESDGEYEQSQSLESENMDYSSGFFTSDEESSEQRVIRSAEEKALDELDMLSTRVHHMLDDMNWIELYSLWSKKLFAFPKKIGRIYETTTIRKDFVGLLVSIEDAVEELSPLVKSNTARLPADQLKVFIAMRGRLNKQHDMYAADMASYRADPESLLYEGEEEEEGEKEGEKDVLAGLEGVKEVTLSMVLEYLEIINDQRGRKKVSKRSRLELLDRLFAFCSTARLKRAVFASRIGATLDLSGRSFSAERWLAICGMVEEYIRTINSTSPLPETLSEEEAAYLSDATNLTSVSVFIDQLRGQLLDTLADVSVVSRRYQTQLKLVPHLEALIKAAYAQCNRLGLEGISSRVLLIHLFLNHTATEVDAEQYEKDCRFVIAHGDDMQRAQAVLYLIFSISKQGAYRKARDMLLMTHLQDSAGHMDGHTQVIYNRVIGQLGQAAFESGAILQAYDTLSELCIHPRLKELFGQGSGSHASVEYPRWPLHMAMDIELLETIHILCAMILEIPHRFQSAHDVKPKAISRNFKRLLDNALKQFMVTPPDTNKELIVRAGVHMLEGEWQQARDYIDKLDIWNKFGAAEAVKGYTMERIKEEGLKAFLIVHSSSLECVDMALLQEMSELEEDQIRMLVNGMIVRGELKGRWDAKDELLYLMAPEPTKLQGYAIHISDRTAAMVESLDVNLDAPVDKGKHTRNRREIK